ncbi:hypothetical protein CaCOL14_008554 [Colletotrichum acutatum]
MLPEIRLYVGFIALSPVSFNRNSSSTQRFQVHVNPSNRPKSSAEPLADCRTSLLPVIPRQEKFRPKTAVYVLFDKEKLRDPLATFSQLGKRTQALTVHRLSNPSPNVLDALADINGRLVLLKHEIADLVLGGGDPAGVVAVKVDADGGGEGAATAALVDLAVLVEGGDDLEVAGLPLPVGVVDALEAEARVGLAALRVEGLGAVVCGDEGGAEEDGGEEGGELHLWKMGWSVFVSEGGTVGMRVLSYLCGVELKKLGCK